MTSTKIDKRVQEVLDLLRAAGATECMLVGGWVRDRILGIHSKDYDVEVYGLGYDKIVETLRPRYPVNLVGKSFGVVKISDWLDISLPRRESKCGLGHRGFEIEFDPTLTPYEATSRRDFTVNAIGLRADGSLFDPFDGRSDLKRAILRAPTEAFCEDPLRVLRGMQFAARFGFRMEERTVAMCRSVLPEFEELAAERIWGEWHKWAEKGRYPSHGLELLRETGWIEKFPPLAALCDVPYRKGRSEDLFEHTCRVCDAVSALFTREPFSEEDRTVLLLAALCHDLGRPQAIHSTGFDKGIAPGHARRGKSLATDFLESMRAPGWVVARVAPLVRLHNATISVRDESSTARRLRWMAHALAPASIRLWAALREAHTAATASSECDEAKRLQDWCAEAKDLGVWDKAPAPLIQGRNLIKWGVACGPGMGPILSRAFLAQLNGVFDDLEGGRRWFDQMSEGTSEIQG